jgi:hypothetical protein
MASISTDPNGRRRLQFTDAHGKRHTIRLGVMQMRHAESVRIRVDHLLSAQATRHPIDAETIRWLADLPDDLHNKLAATGLITGRVRRTLGGWLASFMESRQSLKPTSKLKLEQTKSKLLAHFGDDELLHDITPEAAAGWRANLQAQGLSEAATKIHTGNAKTIFNDAVQAGLLTASPFARLKGGVTPSSNDRFVTAAEIEKVIGVCDDPQWRLVIGLARYAGLRTPSEIYPLTRGRIDFELGRMRVYSPKTERFEGHAERWVPISPRLRELILDCIDPEAPEDQKLITIKSLDARRRKMVRWMLQAEIKPWDDTWQTLRRSCEIEWEMSFPSFAVNRWMGHSFTVSRRHYARFVPDELFAQASGQKATQNPTQQIAAGGGTGSQAADTGVLKRGRNPLSFKHLRSLASTFQNT